MNNTNTPVEAVETQVATSPAVEAAPVEKDGKWVEAVREQLGGLTQTQFALKVGVSQGLVSQVENGTVRLSARFKNKIEALLASN